MRNHIKNVIVYPFNCPSPSVVETEDKWDESCCLFDKISRVKVKKINKYITETTDDETNIFILDY